MRAVSSDTAFSPETLESIHKTHENSVPEIPPHWIFEREGYPSNHTDFCWWPISHFLHHAFCAIGFGHTSLPDVWKVCHPDCLPEVWERERETTRDRLQHVNIVTALILAATTAFCTTEPPGNSVLPYTKAGPYMAFLVSINLSLGGLILGSTVVFATHKLTAQWFNEAMMGSRLRIWTSMIVLSYPFMAAAISTYSTVVGLLIAIWYSEAEFFRVPFYLLAVPPVLCGVAGVWVLVTRAGVPGRLPQAASHG